MAEGKDEKDHVVSPLIYVAVLIALMILLALTIAAAFIDLDRLWGGKNPHTYWNMTIAILIAIMKAFLIILFFMHVKYGSRVTWAFAAAAFVWLGIFFTLTMSDYFTREYPPGSPKSNPMEPSPQIIRPKPRPDSVVGDAGNIAPAPHQALCDARVELQHELVRIEQLASRGN